MNRTTTLPRVLHLHSKRRGGGGTTPNHISWSGLNSFLDYFPCWDFPAGISLPGFLCPTSSTTTSQASPRGTSPRGTSPRGTTGTRDGVPTYSGLYLQTPSFSVKSMSEFTRDHDVSASVVSFATSDSAFRGPHLYHVRLISLNITPPFQLESPVG